MNDRARRIDILNPRVLAVSGILLCLAASCTIPSVAPWRDRYERISPLPRDKAIVYFYRVGESTSPAVQIYLNGETFTFLKSGEYVFAALPAGKQLLEGSTGYHLIHNLPRDSSTVELSAATDYYVRVSLRDNKVIYRLTDYETAAGEIHNCYTGTAVQRYQEYTSVSATDAGQTESSEPARTAAPNGGPGSSLAEANPTQPDSSPGFMDWVRLRLSANLSATSWNANDALPEQALLDIKTEGIRNYNFDLELLYRTNWILSFGYKAPFSRTPHQEDLLATNVVSEGGFQKYDLQLYSSILGLANPRSDFLLRVLSSFRWRYEDQKFFGSVGPHLPGEEIVYFPNSVWVDNNSVIHDARVLGGERLQFQTVFKEHTITFDFDSFWKTRWLLGGIGIYTYQWSRPSYIDLASEFGVGPSLPSNEIGIYESEISSTGLYGRLYFLLAGLDCDFTIRYPFSQSIQYPFGLELSDGIKYYSWTGTLSYTIPFINDNSFLFANVGMTYNRVYRTGVANDSYADILTEEIFSLSVGTIVVLP